MEMNLKVAQSYIKQTGAKVDLARSGEECLRMVCQEKYDMIFRLFIRMCGIDNRPKAA